MTSPTMERKALDLDAEVDDAGTFTGIASAPTRDREGDIITAKAWQFRLPVPLLLNHNQGAVVGRIEEIEASEAGLLVKGRLNLGTTSGRDTHALIRAGDMSGLSVGFITKSATPTPNGRRIDEAELVEVSIVPVPAHQAAGILSVKSLENPVTDISAIESRIEALELAAARPALPATPASDEPTVERKAFLEYARYGADRIDADTRKTLTSGTTAGHTGGYLVPQQFEAELIRNLVEYSPIRQLARVSSASAAEVLLPVRTSGTTAIWTDEWDTTTPGPEARTPSQPTYTQKKIAVHELATYVEVSNRLLEDAAFNLESELAIDLAEAFAKAEGAAFVRGSGNGQPAGFLTDVTLQANAVEAEAHGADFATADSVLDLVYSLPSAYRHRGTFAANRKTIASLRKLKTINGDYLWQPSLQAGQPETLAGYPLVEAPDLDDIEDGKFPLAFGDWSQGFRIFDRVSLSIQRDDYSAAVNGLVRFHARRRVGAGVVKPEALALLKV